MPIKPMTILEISAKCSDCCSSALLRGSEVLKETDGYVPSIMPGGGGDYVQLNIDVATGQILNWIVPTESQLNEFIGNED